ncbi:unnamed protein product [Protopolystoma xenopodis]|uniref:Uncharacterized protein n=1 Tax=Protopolystoma xenopodis TaxID=117903 RepID=A0A448WJZ8_9PLAT|nr:unnamed protein product [Protopolystoma xenopodis]
MILYFDDVHPTTVESFARFRRNRRRLPLNQHQQDCSSQAKRQLVTRSLPLFLVGRYFESLDRTKPDFSSHHSHLPCDTRALMPVCRDEGLHYLSSISAGNTGLTSLAKLNLQTALPGNV